MLKSAEVCHCRIEPLMPNLNKGELKVSGDDIMVKFKCDSLLQAEKIIDMILEPNGLKVAPVNLIEHE